MCPKEAILGEPLEKQACHYAENALCYRYFSRNLVKIYRTAILMNIFWYMQSKKQGSTHPVVFFNPLMLVAIKWHKYLNKPASLSWRFAQVCITLCYPVVLKGQKSFWTFLSNNQMKSEASHQLCCLKKLLKKFQKTPRKTFVTYSAHLQSFKLANMLNSIFPQMSTGPQISASLR